MPKGVHQRVIDLQAIPIEALQSLFRSSSDWIIWKPHSSQSIWVSSACLKITGYTQEEFQNTPELFFHLIHPEDQDWFLEAYSNFSLSTPVFETTVRIVDKQGKIKWIKHISQWITNTRGELAGRLEMNQLLSATEQGTQLPAPNLESSLFNQGPVVVFKWRNAEDWPVEYVSPNVKHVLGYTPLDFLANKITLKSILDARDFPRFHKAVLATAAGKRRGSQHSQKAYKIKHANGEWRWVLIYTLPFPDKNGTITHGYGYLIDVTNQVIHEQIIKQNFKQLHILLNVVEKLNRASSLQAIYRIAVKGIISVLKADRSAILLYGEDGKVHFKSWYRLSAQYRKAVDGHCPWSSHELNAQPLWYEDVEKTDMEPELKQHILNEGIRAMAFIPLKGTTALLGKFMVYYNSPHQLTPEERHFTQILAENIASVISRHQYLQQLRDSEEKYRSIFDNVAEGIYQSTTDGHFITVNQAMANLFGYKSPEEMLAIPNTASLYWDSQERKRLSAIAKQNGFLKNVEVKMKRRDGTPIWVLMNDRAVYDRNGKFLYFEGTLVDITDRKLTEQALKESEQTYRLLIKGAPFPTAVYIDQTVYFCNTATLKLLEADTYDDLIGKNIFELIHPDSQEDIRRQYSAFYEKGQKLPPTEAKLLTLKGNTRYVFVHSVLTRFDGQKAVLVQMIDITEWKKSQQALQESEERFRLAFRTSPDAMSITRLHDGLFLDVNEGFEKITGFRREEVIGKDASQLNIWHTPEDRNKFVKLLTTHGEIENLETLFRLKDGSLIHSLMSARIFNINGEPHVLSIAKNIEPLIQAQKALQESEERLRVLINSTPDIICFKDGEGRWQEANIADLKLFEIEHVDYKGKKDSELAPYSKFYKDAFLTCEVTDEKAWQKGTMSRGIEIIPRPDGTEKYYDVIKIPLFNEDGSRKALVVFGRDITEQKRAEDSLQQQLHFMQALNELTQSIILNNEERSIIQEVLLKILDVTHFESTVLLIINPTTGTVSVTDPGNSLKGTQLSLLNFKEFPVLLNALKAGEEIISTANTPHPKIKQARLHKRLHQQWGIQSFFWHSLGEIQNYIYVIGNQFNTQSHQWQPQEIDFVRAVGKLLKIALMKANFIKELRQKADEIKLLASLVEQAQEIFSVTDLQGKIEYVNQAFEEATGFAAAEVVGKTFQFLRSPKEDPALFKDMWEKLQSGNAWRGRIHNKRKNGEVYVEEAVVFPLKNDEGQTIKYCKIARDISKEIQLEERLRQSQKMEAIGTLAGGIAHDFNNILTPLLGYTELALMSTPPGSPLHNQLEQIYKAGQRAKGLIKQILAFSRYSTGKRSAIKVVPIVKEVLKLLRATIPSTIEIVTHIQNTPSIIHADPVEIHQILMNLCTNAYQAMPHGGTLTIVLKETKIDAQQQLVNPELKPGKYIRLTVKDTGTGIPPEIQSKIFEPYFTTKPSGEGTGLGLAMVHGIVSAYGGTITVYSEPQKGTEFNIYLPISSQTVTEEMETAPPVKGGTETILLVDDEPDIVELGQKLLSHWGYQVEAFVNPQAALQAFRAAPQNFQLIISDMTMPGLTGLKFAEQVRKINATIPIILTTGYSEQLSPEKLQDKTFNCLITKPFSPTELAKKVRDLLDRYQTVDS